MPLTSLTGSGLLLGVPSQLSSLPINGGFSTTTFAATGNKVALCGRVWFPARTGTKNISRVWIRFGSVTKAGGSGLTLSLQDIDLTNGPVIRPDGVQDQTVAIANGDTGFVSNNFYRSNTLSANRTVTYGDRLGIVLEFDGSGRLGADSVGISVMPVQAPYANNQNAVTVTQTAGTWAAVSGAPVVLLEMSDGTFGVLDGGVPITGTTSNAFGSTSTPDEYALKVNLPCSFRSDGCEIFFLTPVAAGDFDVILYEGTTARRTISFDANAIRSSVGQGILFVPWSTFDHTANTDYYVAVRPATTNTLTLYHLDISAASHMDMLPGGQNLCLATRTDAGGWGTNTTRRPLISIRLSGFDTGSGGGAFPATGAAYGGL